MVKNFNIWIQQKENNPIMDDDFTLRIIMAVARCCPHLRTRSEKVFLETLNETSSEAVISMYQGYGYDITV